MTDETETAGKKASLTKSNKIYRFYGELTLSTSRKDTKNYRFEA